MLLAYNGVSEITLTSTPLFTAPSSDFIIDGSSIENVHIEILYSALSRILTMSIADIGVKITSIATIKRAIINKQRVRCLIILIRLYRR